jgi:hypothetical protein
MNSRRQSILLQMLAESTAPFKKHIHIQILDNVDIEYGIELNVNHEDADAISFYTLYDLRTRIVSGFLVFDHVNYSFVSLTLLKSINTNEDLLFTEPTFESYDALLQMFIKKQCLEHEISKFHTLTFIQFPIVESENHEGNTLRGRLHDKSNALLLEIHVKNENVLCLIVNEIKDDEYINRA